MIIAKLFLLKESILEVAMELFGIELILWGGSLGFVTFLFAIFLPILNGFLAKKRFYNFVKLLSLIGLLSAVYTLANGIHWMDWVPPEIDPQSAGKIAARRRGGIFLLIMEFWPYISMIIGALFSFICFTQYRNPQSAEDYNE